MTVFEAVSGKHDVILDVACPTRANRIQHNPLSIKDSRQLIPATVLLACSLRERSYPSLSSLPSWRENSLLEDREWLACPCLPCLTPQSHEVDDSISRARATASE